MTEEMRLNEVDKTLRRHGQILKHLQSAIFEQQETMEKLYLRFTALDHKVQHALGMKNSSNSATPPHFSTAIGANSIATNGSTPLLVRPLRFDFQRFDGSDAAGWIFHAEDFFNYYTVEDSQRLMIASFHMDGSALRWYQSLMRNQTISTWLEFTRLLKIQFAESSFENYNGSFTNLKPHGVIVDSQSEIETVTNCLSPSPYYYSVDFKPDLQANTEEAIPEVDVIPLSSTHGMKDVFQLFVQIPEKFFSMNIEVIVPTSTLVSNLLVLASSFNVKFVGSSILPWPINVYIPGHLEGSLDNEHYYKLVQNDGDNYVDEVYLVVKGPWQIASSFNVLVFMNLREVLKDNNFKDCVGCFIIYQLVMTTLIAFGVFLVFPFSEHKFPRKGVGDSYEGLKWIREARLRNRFTWDLQDSQQTLALVTTFTEVGITNLMQLNYDCKDVFGKKHGVQLGLMTGFVKVVINHIIRSDGRHITFMVFSVRADPSFSLCFEFIPHMPWLKIGCVVWKDDKLKYGVLETLAMLNEEEKRLFFVPNISTKFRQQYGKMYEALGHDVSKEAILLEGYSFPGNELITRISESLNEKSLSCNGTGPSEQTCENLSGINAIATPFLVVFLSEYLDGNIATWSIDNLPPEKISIVEVDFYWCLSKLLDGMQDHYTLAQPGVHRLVFKLKEWVRRIDEPVSRYMEEKGLEFLQFSFHRFNCLLIREIAFHLDNRLWDTYIAEGDQLPDFLVYISASFLLTWSAKLQKLDFQEMVMFLQHIPTHNLGDVQLEMCFQFFAIACSKSIDLSYDILCLVITFGALHQLIVQGLIVWDPGIYIVIPEP